jgi:hypothetical protein
MQNRRPRRARNHPAVPKQIEALEGKIEEGEAKLVEIAHASEEAWESIKECVESAWGSMKSAFKDAATKFRQ